MQRAQEHPVGSKGRVEGDPTATEMNWWSVVDATKFGCKKLVGVLASAERLTITKAARMIGHEKSVSLVRFIVFLPVLSHLNLAFIHKTVTYNHATWRDFFNRQDF